MNEPSSPPPYPPEPSSIVRTRKRWGCLPIGCLVVVLALGLLGAVVGGVYWLVSQGGQAYLSDKPHPIHLADATDDQYQAVLARLAPFNQAINEGHAATLEITLNDFNVLIAQSPQFATLRGRLFLTANNDRIIAEVSVPISDSESNRRYFNSRATLDGSYASNGFVIFLRRLEPLDSAQANTRFTRFLNHPTVLEAVSQRMSDGINEDLQQQAVTNPTAAVFLRDLRTIVFRDGKIVVTTNERPGGAPTEAPTPTPVASGNDQT